MANPKRTVQVPTWVLGLVPLFLSLFLGGCYQPKLQVVESQIEGHGLTFLHVGQTQTGEVLTTLGTPSVRLQEDQILTYRLRLDEDGSFVTVPREADHDPYSDEPQWRTAQYSLVLLFHADHILKAYNLLKVK